MSFSLTAFLAAGIGEAYIVQEASSPNIGIWGWSEALEIKSLANFLRYHPLVEYLGHSFAC